MKRDSKLSGILHILLHMIEAGEPLTSERLASMMTTNPVVIRRLMSGLREKGFVRSEKGHGGGWTVACDPARTTMADIYEALGAPPLLAIGLRTETSACLVEQAVNASLKDAFREAEALLEARFASVTLAELAADFHARMKARNLKEIDFHAA